MGAKDVEILKTKFIAMHRMAFGEHEWFEDLAYRGKGRRHPGKNTWYFVTASGRPIVGDPSKGLAGVLEVFEQLPESDRKGYGTYPLEEETAKWERYILPDKFPSNGMALRVYQRPLLRSGDRYRIAGYLNGDLERENGMVEALFNAEKVYKVVKRSPLPISEPTLDLVWFKESEKEAFVPAGLKKGQHFTVPGSLVARLVRWASHNSVGQATAWGPHRVQRCEMKGTVEEVNGSVVTARVIGSYFLDADNVQHPFVGTFDGKLGGVLTYDAKNKAFLRFDMALIGLYEGIWFHRDHLPTVLGMALEVSPGDWAGDYQTPMNVLHGGERYYK